MGLWLKAIKIRYGEHDQRQRINEATAYEIDQDDQKHNRDSRQMKPRNPVCDVKRNSRNGQKVAEYRCTRHDDQYHAGNSGSFKKGSGKPQSGEIFSDKCQYNGPKSTD